MEATAIDKTHVANDTLERFLASMQSVVLFKAALSQLFFADIAGNKFATWNSAYACQICASC